MWVFVLGEGPQIAFSVPRSRRGPSAVVFRRDRNGAVAAPLLSSTRLLESVSFGRCPGSDLDRSCGGQWPPACPAPSDIRPGVSGSAWACTLHPVWASFPGGRLAAQVGPLLFRKPVCRPSSIDGCGSRTVLSSPRDWPGAGPGGRRSQASESPGRAGGRPIAPSPLPGRGQSGCSAFQPTRLVASSRRTGPACLWCTCKWGGSECPPGTALCRVATGRNSLGSCPSVTQWFTPRCPSAVSQGLSGQADEAGAGEPGSVALALCYRISQRPPFSAETVVWFLPLVGSGRLLVAQLPNLMAGPCVGGIRISDCGLGTSRSITLGRDSGPRVQELRPGSDSRRLRPGARTQIDRSRPDAEPGPPQ